MITAGPHVSDTVPRCRARACPSGFPWRRPPSELRLVVCAALLALIGALWSAGPVGAAGSARAAVASSAAPDGNVYFGLVYPGAPDIPTLQAKEAALRRRLSLVLWYQDWVMGSQEQAFPAAQMDAVRAHGSIPVLAWHPRDGAVDSSTQPAFILTRIADGSWDDYLRRYAAQVKAWGHPFFLRFASEMNGSWIPWSEMANGNQRGQFVRAWRHVHDLFTQVGATNATWTWCPNTEDATTTPLEDLYPGSGYVDWACMDGYNFAADLNGAPWRSFAQIFRGTYQHLLTLIPATMPIMIGEFSSSEHGGSKPEWIKDGLSVQLPNAFPRIKGAIWFDSTNPGIDLRIDTSPQSLGALRAALASGAYAENAYRYLDQSPIPPPGGADPKPSAPPFFHGVMSPAAGYVQLMDSKRYEPLPDTKVIFAPGTSLATDTQGLVALPKDGAQVTLADIQVSGALLHLNLPLDRRLGYQIQIDLGAGEVIVVGVHDPPVARPQSDSLASVAARAFQHAAQSWDARIGLAMLVVTVLALRAVAGAWRERIRARRKKLEKGGEQAPQTQ